MSHVIPVRPPVRSWFVTRLGQRGYIVGYSLLSMVLLGWIVIAANRAPFVPILPDWQIWRWVAVIMMAPVCILVVAGFRASNPLSFGGLGQQQFDPLAPGILAVSRHPLLLALTLWAVAHGVANGDLAHLILFGVFGAFAMLGMILIDRRKSQNMQEWSALARHTSRINLTGWRPDVQTMALAGLLYGLLVVSHPLVLGVAPIPW